MTGIRNNKQLKQVMGPVIKEVIVEILERLDTINKDLINEIVYGAGNPSAYERTYQFRDNAWKIDQSSRPIAGKTHASLDYNPNGMVYVQENAQHGSYYQPPGDAREYLADIIYQGLSGPAFGNGPITGFWAEARDVWSRLIDATEGNLDQWIQEGFNKRGLKVLKL